MMRTAVDSAAWRVSDPGRGRVVTIDPATGRNRWHVGDYFSAEAAETAVQRHNASVAAFLASTDGGAS